MVSDDEVSMDPHYMDYAEHERTYRVFTAAFKWGTVAVAAIIVLMAFFLL